MRSVRVLGRGLVPGLSAGGLVWSRPCHEGDCTLRGLGTPRAWLRQGIGALRCESDARWAFKPEYRGQLTPQRPQGTEPVVLHGGPFGSRWLRIGRGAVPGDVTKALLEAEGASSAIYVGVPDDHQSSGPIISELRTRGFRFHHIFNGETPTAPAGELIYYRWVGKGPDLVPTYATALEGIGVLVLSPDGTEVLLVWEYANWKMITGNVDAGESVVATVRREVMEEVGLDVEECMTLVGGWQDARSRDRVVNNTFFIFLATARSRDVKLDGVEISQAQWFPLASLPSFEDEQNAPQVPGKPFGMEWDMGVPGKSIVGRTVVRALKTYSEGRGLRVQPTGQGALNSRDLFF